MNYISKQYITDQLLTYPNGLTDYEVISTVVDSVDIAKVTCLFRFEISKPDIDGSVTCLETIATFNLVRSETIAQTGDIRVTVAAKNKFKALMARQHSAYALELAGKTADDAEVAKIEEDLKGAVSDAFSR